MLVHKAVKYAVLAERLRRLCGGVLVVALQVPDFALNELERKIKAAVWRHLSEL